MRSNENPETAGIKGKKMAEIESGKSSQKSSRLDAHYASSRKNDFHVTIEWEDLNYYVVTKDSKQSKFMRPAVKNNHILNNVSGRAESGQLLAIMGPTGCGKSIVKYVTIASLNMSLKLCRKNVSLECACCPRVECGIICRESHGKDQY